MTPSFLTEPFLQNPTEEGVTVAWLTTTSGSSHVVEWGEGERAVAETSPFASFPGAWQHSALVKVNHRVPYRVISEGQATRFYTLAPAPKPGQPLKILLFSWQPMLAANLQKAVEIVGRFDAVLLAGPLPITPRDLWSDSRAFFPCLQGTAEGPIDGTMYEGGEILQHAPLFAPPNPLFDPFRGRFGPLEIDLPFLTLRQHFQLELQSGPLWSRSATALSLANLNPCTTVFSVLDTAEGVLESYAYDCSQPSQDPLCFDTFSRSPK